MSGGRLDFEARLRALRTPKSPADDPQPPAAVGPSAVSVSAIDYGAVSASSGVTSSSRGVEADVLAWPSVPLAPFTAASTRRASFSSRHGSSVAVDEHGWPAAPNMTVQRTPDGWPEVPSPLKSIVKERRQSSPLISVQTDSLPEPATAEPATGSSWLSQRNYQQPEGQRRAYQERQQPYRQQQQQPYQQQQQQQPAFRQYEQPAHEQFGAQTQSPPPTQARQQLQSLVASRQEPDRQEPAQLLGPEYDEAIRVAQRAIENERLRHVHTAIDDYILAGQLLIGIGRQHHQAPHLQDVVKKKALALLQRAEGLSEWAQQVQALDASQQALDAAFEASQATQDRALSEQEALVSKMRSDNDEMKQRLNQLVVLTKLRTRLRSMVRERRARKQAEAAAAVSGDPTALSSRPDRNDVEGMSDEEEEDHVDQWYGQSSPSIADDDDDDEFAHLPLPSSVVSFRNSEPAAATVSSSQEEQKVMLVNELRAAIGLPEIDHVRKFEPLSADPMGDVKQEKLQDDLEKARKEAEELRAAVQSMERCLRLAAQHSKQRSIKMEQEKQEDLARVRQELEHVREQLEQERRMSNASSTGSRRSSIQSDVDVARDREELERSDVMRGLRSSLFKVFSHKKSRESLSGGSEAHTSESEQRRSVVQRTSEAQSSPRHRASSSPSKPPQIQRQQPHQFGSDDEADEEDDGGVWL